jgi:hypothetical protein
MPVLMHLLVEDDDQVDVVDRFQLRAAGKTA